jgi:Putative Flp pilus-assembly TadE/G-like
MGAMRIGAERQRGQVLVLFALLLPVLFAALAVLVDGGYLYGQRRSAQNAADAGALAAALAVASGGACNGGATTAANYLALRNGAPGPGVSYTLRSAFTPPGGPALPVCRVAVTAGISSAPFLSGVIGRSTLRAGATATAGLAGISTYGNDPSVFKQAPLLPVAIELSSLQAYGFGSTVQQFAVTSSGANGFFWFLPTSTSCSDTAIDTAVTAATLFTTGVGNAVAICSLESDLALHDLAVRAPVLRTVVLTSSNAGATATVLGFAYLEVETTQFGAGIVPSIFGYFVNVGAPTSGSIGAGAAPNYGLYGVALLQ